VTIFESTGKTPGQDQENTRKPRLWGGARRVVRQGRMLLISMNEDQMQREKTCL